MCHALTGRRNASKSAVNLALYGLFAPEHRHNPPHVLDDTRRAAVGTTAKPGPLWGVTGHQWDALAVAVVAGMQYEEKAKQ